MLLNPNPSQLFHALLPAPGTFRNELLEGVSTLWLCCFFKMPREGGPGPALPPAHEIEDPTEVRGALLHALTRGTLEDHPASLPDHTSDVK